MCVLRLQCTNSRGLPSSVEEKGQQGHSLKRRAPQPLPWQAFIAFVGHYIEEDPHLLGTDLLLAVTENKGEDVTNYIKKEGYLQM